MDASLVGKKLIVSLVFPLLMVGCKPLDYLLFDKPSAAGRLVYPEQENPACPDWNDKTVQLNSDTTLPVGCVFYGTHIRIMNQQHLTFDASEAVFIGNGEGTGIMVGTSNPAKPSAYITVKNAQLYNYAEALRAHRYLSAAERAAYQADPGYLTYIQQTATHDVTFDNIKALDSVGSGFYAWVGVYGITLKNSVIDASGGPGVYLDTGSARNQIINNEIVRNGHSNGDGQPRYGRAKREGVAIDGSFDNLLQGNQIANNYQGGVSLYKNCYEDYTDPLQLPRPVGANGNVLKGNTIAGNDDWAVMIAERQDWELSDWNCGDPLYVQSGGKYYRDVSTGNTVADNTLRGGLYVRGDDNTITGNNVDRIEVGSRVRKLAGEPVFGNQVVNNTVAPVFVYGGQ